MTRRPPAGPHYVTLSDVADEPVDWLIPGYIPVGTFTCLDGDPGIGKSTVANDLTARLTVGAPLPAAPARPPAAVVILNPEDPEHVIKRRIEAAGGDPGRVRLVSRPGPRTNRPVDLGRDLSRLRGHFDDSEVRLIIADNITLAIGRGGRTEIGTRDTLHRVSELAKATATVVVGIRHLRKGPGSPLHRGAGFMAIAGAARSVTHLSTHPVRPSTLIWSSVKANLGPPPPDLTLSIVLTPGGHPAVEWTGTSESPAHAPLRTSTRPKLDAARDLLCDLLRDGPHRWTEIHQAAQDASISDRTIDKAKQSLGITSEQVPEAGVKGPGPSWWSLPDNNDWKSHA